MSFLLLGHASTGSQKVCLMEADPVIETESSSADKYFGARRVTLEGQFSAI